MTLISSGEKNCFANDSILSVVMMIAFALSSFDIVWICCIRAGDSADSSNAHQIQVFMIEFV